MGGDGAARRAEDKGSVVPLRALHARGDARRRNRRSTGIVRYTRGPSTDKEPLMVRKLHNFDDWIDYFKYWQDSIGLPEGAIRAFKFEAKFGDPEVPHIQFGHYNGQRKWPTNMVLPDQRIRDALLNLIVYQGDTEFASVEQQRNLLQHAPSDYDLLSLMRVMTEGMRHGWQMSYLFRADFGDAGERVAALLPARRPR